MISCLERCHWFLGVVDESATADDQNVPPGERRRRNARAWRAHYLLSRGR
jgi:hypothetical protein